MHFIVASFNFAANVTVGNVAFVLEFGAAAGHQHPVHAERDRHPAADVRQPAHQPTAAVHGDGPADGCFEQQQLHTRRSQHQRRIVPGRLRLQRRGTDQARAEHGRQSGLQLRQSAANGGSARRRQPGDGSAGGAACLSCSGHQSFVGALTADFCKYC